MPRKTLAERLHSKTDIGDGCWLWRGLVSGGYGSISVGLTMKKAHRVAYELADCPIPNGYCVMHICDTPLCVRPTHLRLGTQLDNIKDRELKGRGSAARISAADVARIRQLRGRTQAAIAKEYGLHQSAVSRIMSGKRWTNLTKGIENA